MRIRYAGVVVLLAGIVAAALVYAFAGDAPPDAAAAIAGGRLYEYNIERIGGKSAVYAARFNQWLGGLWHGRNLAYTIAILAIAVALTCFLAARLTGPSSAENEESRPDPLNPP